MKTLWHVHKTIRISADQRSSSEPMGRFGGGWNWKLGIQAGGQSIILSLLVFDVRIDVIKPESEKGK